MSKGKGQSSRRTLSVYNNVRCRIESWIAHYIDSPSDVWGDVQGELTHLPDGRQICHRMLGIAPIFLSLGGYGSKHQPRSPPLALHT